MSLRFTRGDFPEGFLFGVATSAYQIEGHGFGGAGQTHWDSFAATPGNVVRAENGTRACDHYHRFSEDLDLVAAGNLDAYRFSTSWARVLPEGRGTPNPEGLDFYDRLADAILARGLKPFATLYHWELPSPLADLGGWTNRDIAGWFGDFTEVIMARIGDRMTAVAPINEPCCVSWLGHFSGQHAPGRRDIRATARAMHHVLLAHGTAIGVMRARGMKNLGAVCNLEVAAPADASAQAAAAATRHDAICNRFFLSGMFCRTYPEAALKGLEPYLPARWQEDFDTISAPLDWLGLNYYTRKLIAPATGPWPALTTRAGPLPKTETGWEIYPEGLRHFLTRVHTEFTRGLPLYLTETGMAGADHHNGAEIRDHERIAFLADHMDELRRAIAEGVPVKGAFIWSLLDNYEWALGYGKRFGLVSVDFDSLRRTPKTSYQALAKALRRSWRIHCP